MDFGSSVAHKKKTTIRALGSGLVTPSKPWWTLRLGIPPADSQGVACFEGERSLFQIGLLSCSMEPARTPQSGWEGKGNQNQHRATHCQRVPTNESNKCLIEHFFRPKPRKPDAGLEPKIEF